MEEVVPGKLKCQLARPFTRDRDSNISFTWFPIFARVIFFVSLSRVIIFKYPLQPDQNCYITRYERLAFHSSLRRKMIILSTLTTSLVDISLKCWENVHFELGSERVTKTSIDYDGAKTAGSVLHRGRKQHVTSYKVDLMSKYIRTRLGKNSIPSGWTACTLLNFLMTRLGRVSCAVTQSRTSVGELVWGENAAGERRNVAWE